MGRAWRFTVPKRENCNASNESVETKSCSLSCCEERDLQGFAWKGNTSMLSSQDAGAGSHGDRPLPPEGELDHPRESSVTNFTVCLMKVLTEPRFYFKDKTYELPGEEIITVKTPDLYDICCRSESDDSNLRRLQPSCVRVDGWGDDVHPTLRSVAMRSTQTKSEFDSCPSSSYLHDGFGPLTSRFAALLGTLSEHTQLMFDGKTRIALPVSGTLSETACPVQL